MEARHGEELGYRGILNATGYVINVGGVVNASFENDYQKAKALKKSEVYTPRKQIFINEPKVKITQPIKWSIELIELE